MPPIDPFWRERVAESMDTVVERNRMRRIFEAGNPDPFNDGPLPPRPDAPARDEQPEEQEGGGPARDDGAETDFDEIDDSVPPEVEEGEDPLPAPPSRQGGSPARDEEPERPVPTPEERREAAASAAEQRRDDPLSPPQAARRRMPPSQLDRYNRN